MQGWHQTVCQKYKRTANPNTGSEDIHWRYSNGIWHRKMKSRKQHMMEGIELLNQGKIRTLGKKETYKYLGLLEADIITRVEMKEKIKKEYLRRIRKLLETK